MCIGRIAAAAVAALVASSAFAATGTRIEFPGPAGVRLAGELFMPERPGRHPAVVLLHGCGGLYAKPGVLAPRHADWAERYAQWGFVALLVDSFGPRGSKALCSTPGPERTIDPWRDRTADAYAALDMLVARPDVDPHAAFAMGWSHGGSTILGVVRPDAGGRRAGGPHFRAAVAFYPGCGRYERMRAYRTTMPLAILHGEADDWTPVAACRSLASRLQRAGQPVDFTAYPGAHHGFDAPDAPVRWLPNVWNPAQPGSRGAHVGTDPRGREQAIEHVHAFLDAQLRLIAQD